MIKVILLLVAVISVTVFAFEDDEDHAREKRQFIYANYPSVYSDVYAYAYPSFGYSGFGFGTPYGASIVYAG